MCDEEDCAELSLLILGASGRVGRRMPRDPADAGFRGRIAPGQPLPRARAALILAGVTSGTRADLARNSAIVTALAAAVRRAGIGRCLYVSSQAVYGQTPPEGAAEDHATAPVSAYGAAKLAAEEALAAALAGSGCRLLILRAGNVAGADQLGQAVEAGGPLLLDRFETGAGPERSMVSAADLLRVARTLARTAQPLPERLNLAAPRPVAMAALLEAAGLPFAWRPAPPGARARISMNCSRLAAILQQEGCPIPEGHPQHLAAALTPRPAQVAL